MVVYHNTYCTGSAKTHTDDDTIKGINEASAQVPWLFYDSTFKALCKVALDASKAPESQTSRLGDRFWSLVPEKEGIVFIVFWLVVSLPKKRVNGIITSLSEFLHENAMCLLGWCWILVSTAPNAVLLRPIRAVFCLLLDGVPLTASTLCPTSW